MAEDMVPIVLLAGSTIVLCLFFWFRYRSRGEVQATIRTAIEKGQDLTPEVVDRLGHPKPPKNKDLRLALIWMALAAGLTGLGFGIPEDDVLPIMLGVSAFPFFLGLAYVLMWVFSGRDS